LAYDHSAAGSAVFVTRSTVIRGVTDRYGGGRGVCVYNNNNIIIVIIPFITVYNIIDNYHDETRRRRRRLDVIAERTTPYLVID